jgi:hypothetical protein
LAVPMQPTVTVPTSSVHSDERPLAGPPPYCHDNSETSENATPSNVTEMPVL